MSLPLTHAKGIFKYMLDRVGLCVCVNLAGKHVDILRMLSHILCSVHFVVILSMLQLARIVLTKPVKLNSYFWVSIVTRTFGCSTLDAAFCFSRAKSNESTWINNNRIRITSIIATIVQFDDVARWTRWRPTLNDMRSQPEKQRVHFQLIYSPSVAIPHFHVASTFELSVHFVWNLTKLHHRDQWAQFQRIARQMSGEIIQYLRTSIQYT